MMSALKEVYILGEKLDSHLFEVGCFSCSVNGFLISQACCFQLTKEVGLAHWGNRQLSLKASKKLSTIIKSVTSRF